jgi:hypothetical protein
VTVKTPAELPAAIVMFEGSTSMIPLESDERVNVRPPSGAGAFRLILPLIVCDNPTVPVPKAKVILGGTTMTLAVPETNPEAEAVMVAVPVILAAVTVVFAPFEFMGIVTLPATVATVVSLLAKLKIWPPGPAGCERITLSVPIPLLPKCSELGLSITAVVVAELITTVVGVP